MEQKPEDRRGGQGRKRKRSSASLGRKTERQVVDDATAHQQPVKRREKKQMIHSMEVAHGLPSRASLPGGEYRPMSSHAHVNDAQLSEPSGGGAHRPVGGELRSYRLTCRNCHDGLLFCSMETLDCASAGCVPCAYKLLVQPTFSQHAAHANVQKPPTGPFVANQRPEECLRMRRYAGSCRCAPTSTGGRGGPVAAAAARQPRVPASAGLYRAGQRILTVGDGDHSFCLCLARALLPSRSTHGQTSLPCPALPSPYPYLMSPLLPSPHLPSPFPTPLLPCP